MPAPNRHARVTGEFASGFSYGCVLNIAVDVELDIEVELGAAQVSKPFLVLTGAVANGVSSSVAAD